jgi:simple sugar transport system ATP-binding protein
MIGRPSDGGGSESGVAGAAPRLATSAPGEETESPVLSARGLGRRHAIHPVDLDIRRGEVVGLAGLLGSGRTELARLLFGLDRADAGQIWASGRKLGRRGRLRSPRAAIRRGLGMLPEDRKTQGLIAELSIRENIVLALQGRRGWLRPLRRRTQRALADKYVRALGIATPSAEKPIGQLSGGNQQKAILARWLATDPILLILDEPTRGVDVGAKAEIEKLIGELCEAGLAILFISAELDEVVRTSRRIVALRDRRKVGELSGPEISEQRLIAVIAGDERGPASVEGERA